MINSDNIEFEGEWWLPEDPENRIRSCTLLLHEIRRAWTGH